MAVSRRLRFEILKRDGHACRYCGAAAPDVKLTVDHVIPVALGGGDEPNNLVTACQPCNAGKSSSSPDAVLVEDVDAAALLWAKAIEEAAYRRKDERGVMAGRVHDFDLMWRDYHYTNGDDVPKDADWEASIERFLSYGLDLDDLYALVRETMQTKGVRDEWRYFCSKVWKEIGTRQELARRLIEDGEV